MVTMDTGQRIVLWREETDRNGMSLVGITRIRLTCVGGVLSFGLKLKNILQYTEVNETIDSCGDKERCTEGEQEGHL